MESKPNNPTRGNFSGKNLSPRLLELEENFKKNGGSFERFKIGDLFDPQVGDKDIQAKHINNKGYLVVSSGLQNKGIIGKSDIEAKVFEKNTITIDMFGNVFFRDHKYKMVTHARIFSLTFKKQKISKEIGLYLVASLLFLNKIFSYNNMASFNKIKDLDIRLPCSNYKISFDFMELYVRELEAERVRELEAYLLASGLNDYQLTDNERENLTGGVNMNLRRLRLVIYLILKKVSDLLSKICLKEGCLSLVLHH